MVDINTALHLRKWFYFLLFIWKSVTAAPHHLKPFSFYINLFLCLFFRSETKYDSGSGMFTLIILSDFFLHYSLKSDSIHLEPF